MCVNTWATTPTFVVACVGIPTGEGNRSRMDHGLTLPLRSAQRFYERRTLDQHAKQDAVQCPKWYASALSRSWLARTDAQFQLYYHKTQAKSRYTYVKLQALSTSGLDMVSWQTWLFICVWSYYSMYGVVPPLDALKRQLSLDLFAFLTCALSFKAASSSLATPFTVDWRWAIAHSSRRPFDEAIAILG
jgi:hypothetical protein